MAKNNVSEYDVIAANNTDISGNNITGTGLVSTADDSFRANSANLAKWWDDLGGVNTVAGTGDAITITTPTVYTALKTGMRFNFKASAINTTAVTLNFDAIGAKAVRKISGGTDVALAAGDIPGANFRIDVIYDAAANAAAGAWILLGSAAIAAATTSAAGIVELDTPTEAATLTDSTRAVTADGLFFLGGYTTTATAAGTTTLTVTSTYHQYFTGTTTQTLVLPVTSTLVLGRSFRVVNNSTGAVTVQSSGANAIVALAPGASGLFTCILTSGTTAASWEYRPGGITLGTAVAASGTAIDFTGLPAGVKKIDIALHRISLSGTDSLLIQIGDSGGVETTGYVSQGVRFASGGLVDGTSTSGFIFPTGVAAASMSGVITLDLVDPSTFSWTCNGLIKGASANLMTTGDMSLSAVLDRVRVTVSGANTFDAGTVNILYWI